MDKMVKHLGKKIKSLHRRRGFTLVEILVAIAVVSTLIVGAIVTLNPIAQIEKSQDATRTQDLQSLKLALDLYYSNNNCYPTAQNSPFAVALESGSEWKEGNSVYMSKVPKDPAQTSYVYVTDETTCPQWVVVFAKLSKPSVLADSCSLRAQSSCVPVGFDDTWACVTSGSTGCALLASGEIGAPGFSDTISETTSTPAPTAGGSASDQDFFVAQPPEVNPQFYEGTISPLFQAVGNTQQITLSVAGISADVASVSVTIKSDTKTQTYDAALTQGTAAEGTWVASWTVDDTTRKRYVITLSGTDTAGELSTFDISIK